MSSWSIEYISQGLSRGFLFLDRYSTRNMAPSKDVLSLLDSIATLRTSYENDEPGSRDSLLEQTLALLGKLEIPSEFLQRTFWAEVGRHIMPYGSDMC